MADQFIIDAFLHAPPLKNGIYKDVIKEIKAGKSGACVYELSGNRILKTYLPRDHEQWFKNGTTESKQKKYTQHYHYESSMSYIRSIRDIVMTMILPDCMSPVLYEYGFIQSNKGLQPFMIMEKVEGIELFEYEPTGTDKDLRILKKVVEALDTFNKCITFHNPFVKPCHRDLHPRNIFVNTYNEKVKLIDFDLSSCPYDLLRTSNSVNRDGLHNMFVNKLIANNIRVTNDYTHHEHLRRVPAYIKHDADLYQIYSVFYYFYHHNARLKKLVQELSKSYSKDDFIETTVDVLDNLLKNRDLKF